MLQCVVVTRTLFLMIPRAERRQRGGGTQRSHWLRADYKDAQWQVQSHQLRASSETWTLHSDALNTDLLGLSFFSSDIYTHIYIYTFPQSVGQLLSPPQWRKGEIPSRWLWDVNWFWWEMFNAEKLRCCKSWRRTATQRYVNILVRSQNYMHIGWPMCVIYDYVALKVCAHRYISPILLIQNVKKSIPRHLQAGASMRIFCTCSQFIMF